MILFLGDNSNLNLFMYGRNNPIKYSDHNGCFSIATVAKALLIASASIMRLSIILYAYSATLARIKKSELWWMV